MTKKVSVKRAYDPPGSDDGYRVLVDRLWPRGVAKSDLKYDEWNKDLAPSPPLRKWFGHKAENWEHFTESYQNELRSPEQKARLHALVDAANGKRITLVYAAKDTEHNHAIILAAELNRLY